MAKQAVISNKYVKIKINFKRAKSPLWILLLNEEIYYFFKLVSTPWLFSSTYIKIMELLKNIKSYPHRPVASGAEIIAPQVCSD
jgi:hypothetical protein